MKGKTGRILGIMVSAFLVLTFSVSDSSSGGGSGGGNFSLAVNHVPEITSMPVITATVGELNGFTNEATECGFISWLPDVADVGDNTINVSVSDGTTADYQEFILREAEERRVRK